MCGDIASAIVIDQLRSFVLAGRTSAPRIRPPHALSVFVLLQLAKRAAPVSKAYDTARILGVSLGRIFQGGKQLERT